MAFHRSTKPATGHIRSIQRDACGTAVISAGPVNNAVTDPNDVQVVLGSTPESYQHVLNNAHILADSLTLNGVTRPITKVGEQGNSAITYKVGGHGWPDPHTKRDVTAYAKSGKTPRQTFDDEMKWLAKINELLAQGKDHNLNWIVFQGVDNKHHITATDYFAHVLWDKHLSRGDVAGCKTEFRTNKIGLIVAEAKHYVDTYHVLHTDIQPGNILWDMAATKPTLIDWGRAKDVSKWTPDVEKLVRQQAEFSHLEGTEKICV